MEVNVDLRHILAVAIIVAVYYLLTRPRSNARARVEITNLIAMGKQMEADLKSSVKHSKGAFDGAAAHLILTRKELIARSLASKRVVARLPLSSVAGTSLKVQGGYRREIELHAFGLLPETNAAVPFLYRPHRVVRVTLSSFDDARSWQRALSAMIVGAPRATSVPPPRKFLALVHPIPGLGGAALQAALPVLMRANVTELDVFDCLNPGDAHRRLSSLSADGLRELDAVLVFGPDAAAAEVVNALVSRGEDGSRARLVPLVPFPTGQGPCAFARSLGFADVTTAALAAVHGALRPADAIALWRVPRAGFPDAARTRAGDAERRRRGAQGPPGPPVSPVKRMPRAADAVPSPRRPRAPDSPAASSVRVDARDAEARFTVPWSPDAFGVQHPLLVLSSVEFPSAAAASAAASSESLAAAADGRFFPGIAAARAWLRAVRLTARRGDELDIGTDDVAALCDDDTVAVGAPVQDNDDIGYAAADDPRRASLGYRGFALVDPAESEPLGCRPGRCACPPAKRFYDFMSETTARNAERGGDRAVRIFPDGAAHAPLCGADPGADPGANPGGALFERLRVPRGASVVVSKVPRPVASPYAHCGDGLVDVAIVPWTWRLAADVVIARPCAVLAASWLTLAALLNWAALTGGGRDEAWERCKGFASFSWHAAGTHRSAVTIDAALTVRPSSIFARLWAALAWPTRILSRANEGEGAGQNAQHPPGSNETRTSAGGGVLAPNQNPDQNHQDRNQNHDQNPDPDAPADTGLADTPVEDDIDLPPADFAPPPQPFDPVQHSVHPPARPCGASAAAAPDGVHTLKCAAAAVRRSTGRASADGIPITVLDGTGIGGGGGVGGGGRGDGEGYASEECVWAFRAVRAAFIVAVPPP